jgi:hypothetical protein
MTAVVFYAIAIAGIQYLQRVSTISVTRMPGSAACL